MLIDFTTLNPPTSPNAYLVCPVKQCLVKPGQESPIFDVSSERLQQAWQQMIARQPRVKLVASYPKQHQFTYVQRSWLFRFPDYITVQFIALDAEKSTLIVYSRAKYGYYDFGVNRKRVQRWLAQLAVK